MKSVLGAVLVLALAPAIAHAAPVPPMNINLCVLTPRDLVRELLGEMPNAPPVTASWYPDKDHPYTTLECRLKGNGARGIVLDLLTFETEAGTIAEFDKTKTKEGAVADTEAGLGDAAYWLPTKTGGAVISRKKTSILAVSIDGAGAAEPGIQQKVGGIASAVLSYLPH